VENVNAPPSNEHPWQATPLPGVNSYMTSYREEANMSISVFSDKEHQPAPQEISDALGARRPLWEKLTQFISNNYQMPGELSYGGKNYGWNVWYRRSGKTLLSLYPQRNSFVAQIVLGNDQARQALDLRLGKNARKVLEETPQLHDGCWLFIKVRTKKDVKDIQQLLQVKKRPRPQRQE